MQSNAFSKKLPFLLFKFKHFWRENDVKLVPKIIFSIMVYSMTFPERTCNEDLRTNKILKYVEPMEGYSTLNFEFSAILLLKIAQI